MAAPQFPAILRKLLDPQRTPLLKRAIDKDDTHLNPNQLRERLPARAQPPD